jgi:dTDP-4-amino-4,6-dideoxygalactose transaminase
MQIPLLDLKAQYQSIRKEISDALDEVLESQRFILGPEVDSLEEKIGAYCGCKYSVGVSSGTDALLICLMAERIGPGDEVITTPYTFFSTVGSISRCGAKPVFVDIQPRTYNIDPDRIVEKISPKTKAIIPVHLFGQCADMDPILEIAKSHGSVVIEDAAQALGADYVSQSSVSKFHRAGSMGDYGCFSFFPSKNLGAFGDGGMVVTNDPERAERVRLLRAHGAKPKYYHKLIGGNFRLDALQAAILNVKWKYLDSWTAKRRENASFYNAAFQKSGLIEQSLLTLPLTIWEERALKNKDSWAVRNSIDHFHSHIYNQYVIRTPQRDDLQKYLGEKGVGTEVYYPVPLHLQECFRNLGYQRGSFPVSEEAAQETLALPIYPELTPEQLEYVTDSICNFFQR